MTARKLDTKKRDTIVRDIKALEKKHGGPVVQRVMRWYLNKERERRAATREIEFLRDKLSRLEKVT